MEHTLWNEQCFATISFVPSRSTAAMTVLLASGCRYDNQGYVARHISFVYWTEYGIRFPCPLLIGIVQLSIFAVPRGQRIRLRSFA